MSATPDLERLRPLLHALSSDDRDERRPWAGSLGDWWREGTLDPATATTLGTVVTWCAMVDDDAGGVRALTLGSLATLAEDGRLSEADLDRLLRGIDAQWIPDNELDPTKALRAALGRPPEGRGDPKGYLWRLVDHVHALSSPDEAERRAAAGPAGAEPGVAAPDAAALAVVSGRASA